MTQNTASIYERERYVPGPLRIRKLTVDRGVIGVDEAYERESALLRAAEKPHETMRMGETAITSPEPATPQITTEGPLNADAIRQQIQEI